MRVVLLFMPLMACVRSDAVTCPDGRLCPSNSTCDEITHACVSDEMKKACEGKVEGDSCGVGGLLGTCHHGACLVGDEDGDGVIGAADNCPLTANSDQTDRDGDGFGDVCDACADLATARNHDEDGDGYGDECDGCPELVDYQEDTDGDHVSRACDGGSDVMTQLAFDPFVDTAVWTSVSGAVWDSDGDSIAPTAALDSMDVGLVATGIQLNSTDRLKFDLGFTSQHQWTNGDRFGIGVVDDNGHVVVACEVRCRDQGICDLQGRFADGTVRISGVGKQAQARLTVTIGPSLTTPGTYDIAAHVEGDPGYPSFSYPNPGLAGHPAVVSSPGLRLRYYVAWSAVR